MEAMDRYDWEAMGRVERARREFGVQVSNLPPGVLGMAPVGGSPSEIHLSANLIIHATWTKVREVFMHEKRHTDQVQLKTGKGPVLIAKHKKVMDETVLYEGDTETYTEKTFGARADRPRPIYGEGAELFHQLSYHRECLNAVMTRTGDVEGLQNAIWEQELRRGGLSFEDIQQQSQETGYHIQKNVRFLLDTEIQNTRTKISILKN